MTAPGQGGERVSQTIFADPMLNQAGVYGNCIQAAVASLLGRPLDAVPHFGAFRDWKAALRLWAEGEGFVVEWLEYPDEIPADGEHCLFLGPSPRGFAHVVVGKGGAIIWDPHPSRDGLNDIDGVIRIYRPTRRCGICSKPLSEVGTSRCYEAHNRTTPPGLRSPDG